MNGPYASDDIINNPRLADYSIGKVVINTAFDWSCSKYAYKVVRNLACRHSIGFFDVIADGGEFFRLGKWTRC
jgi:hypothetical protein